MKVWVTQYKDYAMGWTTGLQFPVGGKVGILSLRHCVQTGSHSFLPNG